MADWPCATHALRQFCLISAIMPPTILFDLCYNDKMNDLEVKSLARQLTLSYASNRRSPTPFNMTFGTTTTTARNDEPNATSTPLLKALQKQDYTRWDVDVIYSSTPWDAFDSNHLTYLTAESDNLITTMSDDEVFVIGGLVDHKDKIGCSQERADQAHLKTARFPISSAILMSSRNAANHKTDHCDISTLACVQLLHSYYKFRDWQLAIYNTPAFHSAPLRKFIRWLPPYEFLNDEYGRPWRLGKDFNLTPKNFRPPTKADIERIKNEIASKNEEKKKRKQKMKPAVAIVNAK